MKCISSCAIAISLLMTHLHSIEVQGHRGAPSVFPENTLPAFQAACLAGAHLIELDVHLTKDKVLVVHHNFALNPSTSCFLDGSPIAKAELIRNLSLDEIKNIDCGSKTNSNFPEQKSLPGTQIPTLEELIDFIRSSSDNVCVNIEIKRDPRFPDLSYPAAEIVDLLLAQVEEKDFSSRVRYSSFDPEVLTILREKAPNAVISFLFGRETLKEISKKHNVAAMDVIMKFASNLKAQILSPHHEMLKSPSEVLAIQEKGFKVVVWTVNDPIRWEQLYEMGVDGIITDYPAALVSFLNKAETCTY